MGNRKVAYRVLVRRPDGKRPLGNHGRGWNENIKIDIQEVDWMNGPHCSDSE